MNQHPENNTSEYALQGEIDKLDESNRKQEERIRNLETKAVQNVNLYFVFQAVILASTTAASSLKCHHWWIPFVLSLLATALNMVAFCDAMFKVLKSRLELDQNLTDLALMKMYRMPKASVTQLLPGTPSDQTSNGSRLSRQGSEIVRPKPGIVLRWKRHLMVYFSIASFMGFSGIVMYGTHVILCNSNDRNCVKMC